MESEALKNRADFEAPIQYDKQEVFLEDNFGAARGGDWESQIDLSEIDDGGVKFGALEMLRKHPEMW